VRKLHRYRRRTKHSYDAAGPGGNPSSGTLFEWGDSTNNVPDLPQPVLLGGPAPFSGERRRHPQLHCAFGRQLRSHVFRSCCIAVLGRLNGIGTEFSYGNLGDSTNYTAMPRLGPVARSLLRKRSRH